MEVRVQSGSGLQFLLQVFRDSGRQRGEFDFRDVFIQQVYVLFLDQIRVIRNINEYIEGFIVVSRFGFKFVFRFFVQYKYERFYGLFEYRQFFRFQYSQVYVFVRVSLFRFISIVSSGFRSSTRISISSSFFEQRLLGLFFFSGFVVDGIIRVQFKSEFKLGEFKLLSKEDLGLYVYRCEDCGKCKCKECIYLRFLLLDWICDKQCFCLVQNVIDYGICVCCVKGFFYYCFNDDEDNCVDNSCFCSQFYCCIRWSVMGVMFFFLFCLWCYFLVKGCFKLCQGCYDRVNRFGCRCKNLNIVCCKVFIVLFRNFEKLIQYY